MGFSMIAKEIYFENGELKEPVLFKEDMLTVIAKYGLDVVDSTNYGRCIEKGLNEGIFSAEELLQKDAEYQARIQKPIQNHNVPIIERIKTAKNITDAYRESTENIEQCTGLKRDPETQCINIMELMSVFAELGIDAFLVRKYGTQFK